MEKRGKITTILVLAVAFCFALVSFAQAGPSDPVTEQWARRNLKNRKKVTSIPIWQITEDGTNKSVAWQDRAQNPRFAIWDVDGDNAGGEEYYVEDLVLDKETGLVWARDANLAYVSPQEPGTKTWQDAVIYCRRYLIIGNRRGWRLPTVEELASLVDPLMAEGGLALPLGHPFINVQLGLYWSSTTYEGHPFWAWCVGMFSGNVIFRDKVGDVLHVWPVRGGSGPILVPHTP